MKLHDLQPGQRFTFTDKHRGKVFRVTERDEHWIRFSDVATRESRVTDSRRKTFRMEVEPEHPSERFTPDESILLDALESFHSAIRASGYSLRGELSEVYDSESECLKLVESRTLNPELTLILERK